MESLNRVSGLTPTFLYKMRNKLIFLFLLASLLTLYQFPYLFFVLLFINLFILKRIYAFVFIFVLFSPLSPPTLLNYTLF